VRIANKKPNNVDDIEITLSKKLESNINEKLTLYLYDIITHTKPQT